MQDEQQQQQQQEAPAAETPAPEEQTQPEQQPAQQHDTVGEGGKCSLCGWEWGSMDPHPVHITPQNVAVPVEGTVAAPEPPPKPEADPRACVAIPHDATCPKCGWTAASGNPHPVL
jgi:hypothetical protein